MEKELAEAIIAAIERVARSMEAVEGLESQLMELNSHVKRGVSIDVTSMPILKQYDVMPILLAKGENDGDRDNTLA